MLKLLPFNVFNRYFIFEIKKNVLHAIQCVVYSNHDVVVGEKCFRNGVKGEFQHANR